MILKKCNNIKNQQYTKIGKKNAAKQPHEESNGCQKLLYIFCDHQSNASRRLLESFRTIDRRYVGKACGSVQVRY